MDSLLIGIVALVLGVANLAIGYRLFRVLIGLSFALAGVFAGAWLATAISPEDTTLLIVLMAAGALILGGLAWFLWSLAIYVAGALFGLSFGSSLADLLGTEGFMYVAIIVLCIIIGGGIALGLRKPVVILATAFSGASMLIYSAEILAPALFSSLIGDARPLLFGIWLGLGLIGSVWQFSQSAEWRSSTELVQQA